jgi:signal transduction histidine kinase
MLTTNAVKAKLTIRLLGYFVVLSVLPLIAVGWVSYHVSTSTLRMEASRRVENLLVAQREYIDTQVEQIDSLMANLYGIEEITNAVSAQITSIDNYEKLATQARIGYILNGYLNIKGLVSIDIRSLNGLHYHVGDSLDASQLDESVFQDLLQIFSRNTAQKRWIGVSRNINLNSRHTRVITAARVLTIFDRNSLEQRPVALLLVNLNIVDFLQRLRSSGDNSDSELIVYDDHSRLVYHPDASRLGDTIDDQLYDKLKSLKGSNVISWHGGDILFNVIPSDLTGWNIVGMTPTRSLTEKSATIRDTTLIALLSCAVVICVAIYSLNLTVIAPLRRITDGFRRLRRGEQVEPLPPVGRDEVGDLTAWFNVFLESWAERERSEKRLSEALETMNALATELERSNADLESFAYIASHDMRQPLRQISSYVTLIGNLYNDKLDDTGREFILFAQKGAKRMDALIVGLLEYSRIGRRERPTALVDLNMALADVVRMLTATIEESDAKILVQEGLPTINGDLVEVERLFQNLIGNALKYRATDRLPVVEVSSRRENGYWTISVSDNGIGIDPAHFERIFGIFQRLHGAEKYEGTGIGLSVCKKIAEHHGGRLWVESRPGRGSVFHVSFPED